jgi:hypothetical protein
MSAGGLVLTNEDGVDEEVNELPSIVPDGAMFRAM